MADAVELQVLIAPTDDLPAAEQLERSLDAYLAWIDGRPCTEPGPSSCTARHRSRRVASSAHRDISRKMLGDILLTAFGGARMAARQADPEVRLELA